MRVIPFFRDNNKIIIIGKNEVTKTNKSRQ